MEWFYAEAGRQIGPIDETAFQNLVASGTIKNDTLVWRGGMPTWQPYQSMHPAAQPPVLNAAPAETRFCSECGKPYPPGELIAFGASLVCAACKPVFTQKLREGVQLPGSQRYAGFWIRVAATLLDSVLLYIVFMIFFAIAMVVFGINFMTLGQSQPDIMKILALELGLSAVSILVSASYEIWMIGRFGATLGKKTCGLLVVRSDGSKLSYERSAGRHFAKYLNGFTLGIGYIMAGVDDEKRGLHDRICDTRVIKK